MLPLPGTDHNGRPVMVSRPGVFDPHATKLDDMVRACSMLFDVWMEEEEVSSVTGIVMVEDVKDFSLSHATAMPPVAIKKMMTLFQVFCLTFSVWSLGINKRIVNRRN